MKRKYFEIIPLVFFRGKKRKIDSYWIEIENEFSQSWTWSWSCTNRSPRAQHRAFIKTRCLWTDVHVISMTFVIGVSLFCLYFSLTREEMVRLRVCAGASKAQWQTCKTKENRNNQHFQEDVFVCTHEGLLANGVFAQFHTVSACYLYCPDNTFNCIEIQCITKDIWLHEALLNYSTTLGEH